MRPVPLAVLLERLPARPARPRGGSSHGGVVYPRCCGLEGQKKTVVACGLVSEVGRPVAKEVRTCPTMSADLLQLADWLRDVGCTQVARESPGVDWKPIDNLLEDALTVRVVKAQHVKAVPGRKTEVADSEWLADLLRHGRLRASFIPPRPPRPQGELRDLRRSRTALRDERVAQVNRLQKILEILEGGNIQGAWVVCDITGKSGHDLLLALVAGRSEAAGVAQVACGTLRGNIPQNIPQLERALAGQFRAQQRFLVAHQLAHRDARDHLREQVGAEVAERLPAADAQARLWQSLPGIGQRLGQVMLAEIGGDRSRLPSARQLASWVGLCPGNQERAGKRQSGRPRKGSPWLRAALVEAAQAAGRRQQPPSLTAQ